MRVLDGVALAVGAAAGLGLAGLMRWRGRHGEVDAAGIGLVTMAAIYPVARRSLRTGGVSAEAAIVVGAIGLSRVAARFDSTAARRLLASAWAAHALFDVLRGPSTDSRLPDWYPAMCVGYDLAVAGRLAA